MSDHLSAVPADYDGPIGENPAGILGQYRSGPTGEAVTSMVTAVASLDRQNVELDELRYELAKVREQRDDARAQRDTISEVWRRICRGTEDLAVEHGLAMREADLLRDELHNLTAHNDRLQDQHAEDLCHIDELEADKRALKTENAKLQETVARMRSTR